MKRILSSELSSNAEKIVIVEGWLHKKRALGKIMFILLRDRHGLIQVVVANKHEQQKLQALQPGTVLRIKGNAMSEKRAVSGAEIHDPTIEIIVPIEETAPIEIDKPINHNSEHFDTLFDNRMVNIRNLTEQGIFKIQAGVGQSLRRALAKRDFTEIHTPKILADATEGGAEVFKLDYFNKTATLAQSPQFYKQMMIGAYERVFEIAPVFRAEPSMTTRHMSEYTSVDAEMGFIESFDDVLDLLTQLLNQVSEDVWQNFAPELESLGSIKPKLKADIPSFTLEEVHKLYSKVTGEKTVGEKDLAPAEERWICQHAAEKFDSEAVFVTDWPADSMKFYHYADPERPAVAIRADLLFRGIEIVTGSQREHRYNQLVKQLKAMGGDATSPGFHGFLQAFKYGLPPHGGFGLGLERLTQTLIGLGSVKEATLFPRDMQRLAP